MNRSIVHMIFGLVFILLGVIMIFTGGSSRVMAYGDIVIGLCLLILAWQAKKKDSSDKKDGSL